MTWRKAIAGFLTTIVAAGVLAGCAGSKKEEPKPAQPAPAQTAQPAPAPKKEKVTIEFWGWWNSPTRKPTIDKIVKMFNDKYKDQIEVKYVFVGWGDLGTKLVASIAAGNPPDVVASTGLHETPFKAMKRHTQDLSQFGANDLKAQFPEGIWNSVLYQGKPYALPWVGDTKWLYINNQHMKDAGLDPVKDAPKTWADLEKLADKLTKKDGNKITRVGFHPLLGNYGIQGWVWNAGGDFFDNRGFPTANSDQNVKTLEWLKSFNDKYGQEAFAAFQAGAKGTGNLFGTEKVSMIIETPTHEGDIKKANPKFDWTIVPVPTPDGKLHKASTYSGAFAIEVPTGAKHPKEGFEFAKFWATEAALVWAVDQNEFAFFKGMEGITAGRAKQVSEFMHQYTSVIPVPVFAPAYLDAISAARDDVLAGKADAKKALGNAQNAIKKMVQENSSK